jgi:hypothetical protein
MKCNVMNPHLTPNENSQPIQWTERPTGALVAAGLLWPLAQWNQGNQANLLRLHTCQ